jgi:hypothetical protein
MRTQAVIVARQSFSHCDVRHAIKEGSTAAYGLMVRVRWAVARPELLVAVMVTG